MRLCLGSLEMIDHVFLMYIHPFIVIPIVKWNLFIIVYDTDPAINVTVHYA